MSIFKFLKEIAPEAIKKPLRRVFVPYLLRRSWMVRKSKEGDDQISIYWNADKQPNRKYLIDILIQEFKYLDEAAKVPPQYS